jgi:hypothetical protein
MAGIFGNCIAVDEPHTRPVIRAPRTKMPAGFPSSSKTNSIPAFSIAFRIASTLFGIGVRGRTVPTLEAIIDQASPLFTGKIAGCSEIEPYFAIPRQSRMQIEKIADIFGRTDASNQFQKIT